MLLREKWLGRFLGLCSLEGLKVSSGGTMKSDVTPFGHVRVLCSRRFDDIAVFTRPAMSSCINLCHAMVSTPHACPPVLHNLTGNTSRQTNNENCRGEFTPKTSPTFTLHMLFIHVTATSHS